MNNQTIYWLWIQNVLGYASQKITSLMNRYTFAEEFYRASFEEKLLCGCFSEAHFKKLKDKSLDNCSRIMEYCKKNDIDIITPGDAFYPSRLKTIKAPPAVLFVKGDAGCLSAELSVAVIGTRQATAVGCTAALSVTKELCQNNAVIVSGGAKGIDTMAHKTAMDENSKTICILGHGHARCGYNCAAQLILRSKRYGVVVSEYVPFELPSKNTYPLRDRLISGMADCVVVIESGEKGGTMITVKAAKSQNRALFAYRFPDKRNISKGTAMLIANGVIPISSGNEVMKYYRDNTDINNDDETKTRLKKAKDSYFKSLSKRINRGYSVNVVMGEKPKKTEEELTEDFFISHPNADRESVAAGRVLAKEAYSVDNDKEKTKYKRERKGTKINSDILDAENIINTSYESETVSLPDDLSSEAVKVYDCLSKTPVSVDKIVEVTGLNIKRVNSALTELELEELIEGIEGRRYLKK